MDVPWWGKLLGPLYPVHPSFCAPRGSAMKRPSSARRVVVRRRSSQPLIRPPLFSLRCSSHHRITSSLGLARCECKCVKARLMELFDQNGTGPEEGVTDSVPVRSPIERPPLLPSSSPVHSGGYQDQMLLPTSEPNRLWCTAFFLAL